jgi:peroxiredoxin
MPTNGEMARRLSPCFWALATAALYGQTIKTGPAVGQQVPAFSATDQSGRTQTLQSIMGPKGAMLVFFRSADWCPYCKIQLVELQESLGAIRKQGLGVAAISYDSIGTLKNFTDRQHIAYPLLSDPDSKIIRAFDILNETTKPGTFAYGIPYPGIYIVDMQGKVMSKYFEDDFRERVSTGNILARQFGVHLASAQGRSDAKHIEITAAASNDLARPGLRIALTLELELKPGMHVYAPGVQGYIPIDWRLDEGGPAAKRHPFKYPQSEMLRLKAIGETVPVYRRHVRIVREITFGQEGDLNPLLTPSGELIVKGSFRYQACDESKCYVPEDAPLEWRFKYQGLDRQRAPLELQRKPE